MTRAMAQAGITPSDVNYINAHGTASPLGDRTEIAAISEAFAGARPGPWINSTKSLTGHCMSAAGVIEAIACVLQIDGGFAHANLNLEEPIESGLRLVGPCAQPCEIEYALSNCFGFGGINSSVIFKRAEER